MRPVTIQDWHILVEVMNQSRFFRWWIPMAAGNTSVADPIDTVHHKMDSTVRSHRVYKSMISVFTSNIRTTPPREGACWPINTVNLEYVAVIKDSYIGWPHSVGNLVTDPVVLYYMKGFCRPLSSVFYSTGRRAKGKGLEVLCKYSYYCGPTKDPALIRDLAFILL